MSTALELNNHRRCRMELLESRCLLAVDFVDSGQELGDLFTQAVALGDMDGDGVLDPVPEARNSVSRTDIALGDLDGDGDLDAAIRGLPWLNDGNGNLTRLRDSSGHAPFQGANFSVLGDLDGDGDLDTIAPRFLNRREYHVWLNDGNGWYPDSVRFAILSDPRDAAFADFDADGDLDVVVASGDMERTGIWFNDGTGVFSDHASIGDSVVNSLAVGDLDGDRDMDIILGNTNVLLNDGNANFEDTLQHLGSFSAEDIALGDVDNDGDLDALIVTGFQGENRLWLNDGTGFFTQLDTDFGDEGYAVALGDLDNDGDLDAYVGHLGPDKIWLNQLITSPRRPGDANGDGVFDRDDIVQVLQAGKFMTEEPASWEEGDWNGDGRFNQLDLIAALQENAYSSDGSP